MMLACPKVSSVLAVACNLFIQTWHFTEEDIQSQLKRMTSPSHAQCLLSFTCKQKQVYRNVLAHRILKASCFKRVLLRAEDE